MNKKEHYRKQERARIFKDGRHDVYREKQKYKGPARCPNCNSLFIEGRWTWKDIPAETYEILCPACRRIGDNYPAGIIELSGSFIEDHHKEIMDMLKNLEQVECSEHPLERIMDIKREQDKTVITTTGIHLPRRLGQALKNGYHGELHISYEAENFIRVRWQR